MIEKIFVDNCLSFKNPTVLSIGESNISCFFGGNGSGKTNLIFLLRFLREWLSVKSNKLDRSDFQFLPRFRLSSSRKLKSTIGIILLIDNERFDYNIEFTENGATSEVLLVDDTYVIDNKLH